MSEQRTDNTEEYTSVILGVDPADDSSGFIFDFYNEEDYPYEINNTADETGHVVYDFGYEPIVDDGTVVLYDFGNASSNETYYRVTFDFYNEEEHPDEINNTGINGADVITGNTIFDFGLITDTSEDDDGTEPIIYDFDGETTQEKREIYFIKYITDMPNTNALYIDKDTYYEEVYIKKTGNSTNEESARNGDNGAVFVEELVKSTIYNSTIDSSADYGIGLVVIDSQLTTSNVELETFGSNSPGVYVFRKGKYTATSAEIEPSGEYIGPTISSPDDEGDVEYAIYNENYIKTNGAFSPAIVFGDRSRIDITDTTLSTRLEESPIFKGTFRNSELHASTVLGFASKSHIAVIEAPAKLDIRDSELSAMYGFNLIHEGERTEHNYKIDLTSVNIIITDRTSPIFRTSNGDFYINIDNCNLPLESEVFIEADEFSDTQVSVNNTDINGEIIIDNKTMLRLSLNESTFTGSIPKAEGEQEGSEYFDTDNNIRVTLTNSVWNLTQDTYITELSVDKYSDINLNGHQLTIKYITSELVVGSVVNYHSPDGTIIEEDVIVIRIIDSLNPDEPTKYVVYDSENHITYLATIEDIIFTGRVVDIQPLLDEIEELKRRSIIERQIENGDTLTCENSRENVIIVDNETKSYTDVTVIKSGRGDTLTGTNNAAILVCNNGIFNYNYSEITTADVYSPAAVITGNNSALNSKGLEIVTSGNFSVPYVAVDNGHIEGSKDYLEANGEGSNAIYVDSDGSVRLFEASITTNGNNANVIHADNGDVTLEKSIIGGHGLEGTHLIYAVNGANVSVRDGFLESESNIEAIYVNNSEVLVDPSIITTVNQTAFLLEDNSTVTSSNNDIRTGTAIPVIIRGQNNTFTSISDKFTTSVIGEDELTHQEIYPPVIKISEGTEESPITANITIDGSEFNNDEVVFLDLSGHCTVNLYLKNWVRGNILVADEEDVDNVVLNIYIYGRWVGVINKHQFTQKGTVNVRCVESGIWDLTDDVYISSFDAPAQASVIYNTKDIYVNGVKYHFGPDTPIDIDSGYTTSLSPTQRILKILHSKNLPKKEDRDKDYMYFAYDLLHFYVYQSLYTDPFCIVEKLPTNTNVMAENMVYITMDGNVYTYISYKVIKLGNVENYDPSQLQLLRMCGTTYFMNAESRYLDLQTRTIQLPFQNGSYQLNLSLAKDLIIDEETVIRFDPLTNQFYIAGKEYQFDDKLNNIGKYRGVETSTMYNYIDGYSFRSYVKISNNADNGLVLRPDGLFINASDLANNDKYVEMVNAFATYKRIIDNYVDELREAVLAVAGTISENTIAEKIHMAVVDYAPTIDSMFNNYDLFLSRLNQIENIVNTEFNNRIDTAKQEIKDFVNQTNNAWQFIMDPVDDTEEYSTADYAVRSDILSSYRSTVITLRNLVMGASILGATNNSGLTESEEEVLNMILGAYESARVSAKYRVFVSSYEDLPSVGNIRYLYYVTGEELFQIYTWRNPVYHEDGTIEIPGDYILIYDEYPVEPEPPEPDEPAPEDPNPEDPDNPGGDEGGDDNTGGDDSGNTDNPPDDSGNDNTDPPEDTGDDTPTEPDTPVEPEPDEPGDNTQPDPDDNPEDTSGESTNEDPEQETGQDPEEDP